MPQENDLEGKPDMGGKHGGQAGMPKSPRKPQQKGRDEDVVTKRQTQRTGPDAAPTRNSTKND